MMVGAAGVEWKDKAVVGSFRVSVPGGTEQWSQTESWGREGPS